MAHTGIGFDILQNGQRSQAYCFIGVSAGVSSGIKPARIEVFRVKQPQRLIMLSIDIAPIRPDLSLTRLQRLNRPVRRSINSALLTVSLEALSEWGSANWHCNSS